MGKIIITTDGSSISANNEKGFDAASAFAIYYNNKLIHKESKLLLNHTNNYAEMYAIYKGTKYLVENSTEIFDAESIMIVTDSQLCEKTLNEWMKGWLKKTDNEVLMSTTGKVKNQELIKSAYINILLLSLTIPVYVCHINSHNNESKIPEMHKKFVDKYFDIDIEEFKLIFEGNQIVDKLAYDTLNEK
jgi:ribonuclease HI